jgi:hypothetical protein
MKILKKDLNYQNINDKSGDIGIILNGINLINMKRDQAAKFLRVYNLINEDGDIIIPKGVKLIDKNQCGGAEEYKFVLKIEGRIALIELDLAIDDKEYF